MRDPEKISEKNSDEWSDVAVRVSDWSGQFRHDYEWSERVNAYQWFLVLEPEEVKWVF